MKSLPIWKAALCGLTIATLLLFPLLNAIAVDNAYWLHWRTQDTVETICVWLLIAGVAFASLVLSHLSERERITEGVNVAWLALGGFFVTGGLVKVSVLVQHAARYRSFAPWVAAVLLLALMVGVVWLLYDRRRVERRYFHRLTIMMSPLVLVFLFNLGKAQWEHLEQGRRVERVLEPPVAATSSLIARPRTVVLLFDELSADYLYGGAADELAQFPNLRDFVTHSKIYSGAYLPGGHTSAAIPSLFGDLTRGPWRSPSEATMSAAELEVSKRGGLVALLVQRGLDVRVFGWYLDYCTGIAALANQCKAISVYNARTLETGFSLLHPLWTNLNLLPAQSPFGMAKVGPAIRMHEVTYLDARSWFRQQLSEGEADVIYVHVNLPHLPFLGDGFSGNEGDRFVMTRDHYVQQFRFVDDFLGFVTQELKRLKRGPRSTNIIVMSDHNVRALTPEVEHEHVVFLQRREEDRTFAIDPRHVHAGVLLTEMLENDGQSGR